ncbi:MAG: ACP S-malonyltransferase [Phycisphaerae bacterium]|nr:ACP S-malonyltransferase [Phycisphaerae bacterium]
MKTLFMFPGQGAQHIGMGKSLSQIPEIAELYQNANEIVGYDLASICFDGPEDKLNMTDVSQPAIFVTSAACLKAMRMGKIATDISDIKPDCCAGLSLGEYTALYAAGAMTFEQGLKLVQLRGSSMQEAANNSQGSMVSILGMDEQAVDKLCAAVLAEAGDGEILTGVNYNCPGQIVVSGSIKACELASAKAEEFGASRAVPLKVAGAFHSTLMAPAAEKLGVALQGCSFTDTACPVIANVDALAYVGPAEMPEKLMKQLVDAVRWQQSIEKLLDDGFEQFVEIGPGRVLTGLVKKIARNKKIKINIITVNGQ